MIYCGFGFKGGILSDFCGILVRFPQKKEGESLCKVNKSRIMEDSGYEQKVELRGWRVYIF